MSLITSEQDDPAVLRAEDEAILAAANPTTKPRTALDDLAEILSGDPTTIRPEDAG